METIKLIKKSDDGLTDIKLCNLEKQGAKIAQLRELGYKNFEEMEQPQCEEGFCVVEHLDEVNGTIKQRWEVCSMENL